MDKATKKGRNMTHLNKRKQLPVAGAEEWKDAGRGQTTQVLQQQQLSPSCTLPNW